MMGSKECEFTPLVNVSLEQLAPIDRFYRHLHKSLDLSFVRELVAPYDASGGHPSIDPVVFFKLQLIMFFEGIVEQCRNAGLVWGKELYFDGTQGEANADDDAMLPHFYVEAMQAMRAHLAVLFPNDPQPQHQHQPEPIQTESVAHAS